MRPRDLPAFFAATDKIAADLAAHRAQRQALLVEGAGGALVPLNASECVLDLARVLRLPVLVVVGVRLGCINHALLTVEAVRARGLALAGWVANRIDPGMPEAQASIDAIAERLALPPVAQLAFGAARIEAAALARIGF